MLELEKSRRIGREMKKLLFFIVSVAIMAGFIWVIPDLIFSEKCDLCGGLLGKGNQRAEWWLCNECSSKVAREARIRQGIPYSIEQGYIETNPDTRDYELEVIEELIGNK